MSEDSKPTCPDDGGPAFPTSVRNESSEPAPGLTVGSDIPPFSQRYYPGLTKRDYFAAAALTGMLSNVEIAKSIERRAEESGVLTQDAAAVYAYWTADAMLKARKPPLQEEGHEEEACNRSPLEEAAEAADDLQKVIEGVDPKERAKNLLAKLKAAIAKARGGAA